MNFRIERARATDFLKIAALDRVAWPQAPDTFIPDGEHIWRVWSEYGTLIVARSESAVLPHSEDIVGALVHFPTQQGEIFLHKIFVHPSCRGSGIGSALMREGLNETAAPVLLTVDPNNHSAVKLYESFGFKIRERIDGFYRPQEDRYVMVYRSK